MGWSYITSWIADKITKQKVLAADFNLIIDYIKKIYYNTVYLLSTFEVPIIGRSMRILYGYKAIAADHPWFCMSLPDQILDIANFTAEFIAEMRSQKIVYDRFNTNVSAFGGTWSGNVFTLTNNAANNAMLTELAEDWLFALSPTANWRILSDGTNEFNITGISVSARTITVNLDGKTASGTSIIIYLNRVYGSTTSCRHFSWAGLGLYMTGQNKITGLRRRDKFQGHWHRWVAAIAGSSGLASGSNYNSVGSSDTSITIAVTDGADGIPRTGPKTEIESATVLLYLYVGEYTA